MAGVLLSPEYNEQVKRVVREELHRLRGNVAPSETTKTNSLVWQWAITNAAIAAASNGLSSPGTGEVEVLRMDHEDQSLSRSGVTHTASNRSESTSIEEDTLVIIALFQGERIIMWADCAALASPPA